MRRYLPSTPQIRRREITPAAETEPNPPAAPGVRHGYTIAAIARIARAGVYRAARDIEDYQDQLSAALYAVIRELHAQDCDPGVPLLVQAARRAVQAHNRREWSNHGWDPRTGQDLKGYIRYWVPGAPDTLADQVTERVAVRQVLATLTRRQNEVVEAIAECDGDHKAAALLLGVKPNTVSVHLRAVRAAFLPLWFEHETPPQADWRHTTYTYGDEVREAKSAAVRRSIALREQRLGRARLTVAECEQVRARHAAGEPLRAIARDLGRSRALVTYIVDGRYEAAPNPSPPGARDA